MSSVDLGRVVAEVSGEGFPVVMIHGLGGSSNTFQPQMAALGGFRVIRPDLPGAGRSPVPFGEQSIEGFADAIAEAVRTLGVERAHFVGHSLGTLVCQRIAVARPGLVASLTLFGALIEATEAMRNGLTGRARLARTEGMVPIADQIINGLAAGTKSGKPAAVAFVRESIMRQDPEGYAKCCEALAKATAADARLIAAPSLLIAGDSDMTAPVSVGQQLADKLPQASLSVIAGSGHWLTIEQPEESNERLSNFLKHVQ